MKSLPLETLIKTSCKNCTFAKYNEKTQIGCEFDRIRNFKEDDVIEAYDDYKEFYIIKRPCNYYRNTGQNYSIEDTQKVKQESAVSFDILLNYNQFDKNNEKYIIDFINSITYYTNKYKLILFHEYSVNADVKDSIVNILSNIKKHVNIIISESDEKFLNSYLRKSKNKFHILLNNSNIDKINQNYLYYVENVINVNLKPVLFLNHNNISCVHNAAYKLYSKHNKDVGYDKCVSMICDDSKKRDLYLEF